MPTFALLDSPTDYGQIPIVAFGTQRRDSAERVVAQVGERGEIDYILKGPRCGARSRGLGHRPGHRVVQLTDGGSAR
jgi:hypothetical protein